MKILYTHTFVRTDCQQRDFVCPVRIAVGRGILGEMRIHSPKATARRILHIVWEAVPCMQHILGGSYNIPCHEDGRRATLIY